MDRRRGSAWACDRGLCAALTVLLAVGSLACSSAQVNAPFPIGYSMGNGGAIAATRGIASHQPWLPASIADDSLRWGFSVAGVQYYDRMDNMGDRWLVQGAAGGWYAFRYATVKLAVRQLNALGVYFEQSGVLSVGTRLIPYVSVSLEAEGHRAGLRQGDLPSQTMGEVGASIWVPRRYVAFSTAVRHLVVKRARIEGLDAYPTLSVGIHTDTRLVGAQGVASEVIFAPGQDPRVRFLFGEEYWFHPRFGLTAGVATEPLQFSAGATFLWAGFGGNVSLVHHPALGWSEGFMADWAR